MKILALYHKLEMLRTMLNNACKVEYMTIEDLLSNIYLVLSVSFSVYMLLPCVIWSVFVSGL